MSLQQMKLGAWTCAAGLLLLGCNLQTSSRNLPTSHPQRAQKEVAPPPPTTMQLQGVLKDHTGHAVSGIAGVTFAIYADHKLGAPLWMETQNVEANKLGRYAVSLGSTKREGLPRELFPRDEARWLGVQILMPGELEQRLAVRLSGDRLIARNIPEQQSQGNGLTPNDKAGQQDSNVNNPRSNRKSNLLRRRRQSP
jgi:hypothetical protein